MTRFERWFFKRIVRREVVQGGQAEKVVNMYHMIHTAAADEFTEDNSATLNGFLEDCHGESIRRGTEDYMRYHKLYVLKLELENLKAMANKETNYDPGPG